MTILNVTICSRGSVMANIAEAVDFQAAFVSQATSMRESNMATRHRHLPLSFAPVDVFLRVVHFGGSKGVARRLSSMGVTENSVIKIMHQAGGHFVIAVENTRLAIEPSIAHKVTVVPIAD